MMARKDMVVAEMGEARMVGCRGILPLRRSSAKASVAYQSFPIKFSRFVFLLSLCGLFMDTLRPKLPSCSNLLERHLVLSLACSGVVSKVLVPSGAMYVFRPCRPRDLRSTRASPRVFAIRTLGYVSIRRLWMPQIVPDPLLCYFTRVLRIELFVPLFIDQR
jgi:hypothetical protein